MKGNRYQNQCFLVRAYRWCRWKPLVALQAVWHIVRHPTPDDRDFYLSWYEYVQVVWDCYMADADFCMEHYYTPEEVMGAW